MRCNAKRRAASAIAALAAASALLACAPKPGLSVATMVSPCGPGAPDWGCAHAAAAAALQSAESARIVEIEFARPDLANSDDIAPAAGAVHAVAVAAQPLGLSSIGRDPPRCRLVDERRDSSVGLVCLYQCVRVVYATAVEDVSCAARFSPSVSDAHSFPW